MSDAATDHGVRKHARISPSGIKNFEICPGYISSQSGAMHPVTIEGTLIHEALDQGSTEGLTAAQIELYEYCTAYASMLPTTYGEVTKEPKLDVVCGVFGYVDQVQVLGTEADVLDWKMGWGKVDAADINSQGQAYGLGVFNKYEDVETVTVHFVQPRLGYVTSHRYTREDVEDMSFRVRAVVAAVNSATDKDYRPCKSNCLYCARTDCSAIAGIAYDVAKKYLEKKDQRLGAEAKLRGEEAPKPLLDSLPTEFYPSMMTDPEQLSRALDLAPVLEAWGKSCSQRAKAMRIEEGIEIPGWELAHRKGRKNITCGGGAWDAVKHRLSPEDFAAACKPQFTKLKEIYTETSEKGKKAADGRELEQALVERDALSGGWDEIPYLKKKK